MKPIIDTIFEPLLNWLNMVYNSIMSLQVPASYPLDISGYLGVFAHLGSYWITFITTTCFLAFLYVVILIILASKGLVISFKDMVKWW